MAIKQLRRLDFSPLLFLLLFLLSVVGQLTRLALERVTPLVALICARSQMELVKAEMMSSHSWGGNLDGIKRRDTCDVDVCVDFAPLLSVVKPSFSFPFPLFPTPDTSLQLRRDVIFCQAVTGAVCTLAEQLLAALRSRFNNAGEYQEDGKETSRKWLEQISVIGALLHFQSTLAPHVVSREGFFLCLSSSLFRV